MVRFPRKVRIDSPEMQKRFKKNSTKERQLTMQIQLSCLHECDFSTTLNSYNEIKGCL